MQMYTHKPPAPLSQFVEVMWEVHDNPTTHAQDRMLPSGSLTLIFSLRDDNLRVYSGDDLRLHHIGSALIAGPQSKSFVIDTAQQSWIFGLNFRPGGAFPFLGMPADELQDLHLSLESVWGPAARRIRERLLGARAPQDRFAILERALLDRARSLAHHPAVAFALGQFAIVPHVATIAQTCERANLSQRRFIQVFREQVGLTPKTFCRLLRFRAAIDQAALHRRVDWPDVALACGYYDQAHFINDFREFSGLTPTDYLKQRGPHLNHVPVPS